MKNLKVLLFVLIFMISLLLADGAPYGLRFKGNGYVDMTSLVGEIKKDFTWSVWINSTDEDGDGVSGDKDIIICTNEFNQSDGSFSQNHLLWFIGNDDDGDDHMYLHDGSYESTENKIEPDVQGPDNNFSNDMWHHVAFVFEYKESGDNNIKIYVNGDEVLNHNTNTNAIGSVGNDIKLLLGADYDSDTDINDFFEGGMDELTIWNKALSPTEIGNLSAMGGDGASPGGAAGKLPFYDGLVARFQFNPDEVGYPGAGNKITDDITSTTTTPEYTEYTITPIDGPDTNNKGVYASEYSDYSLPVELSYFTAKSFNGGAVKLEWETSSEIENAGFIVQRRVQPAKSWATLASYENNENLVGYGTTSEAHTYSLTDRKVIPGRTFEYRLVDVANDGTKTYHDDDIQTVTVGNNDNNNSNAQKYNLVEVYPNPFNPVTNITYNLKEKAEVTATIYDVAGHKVEEFKSSGAQKSGSFTWNASDLHNGVYFIHLRAGTFTSVEKCILIK